MRVQCPLCGNGLKVPAETIGKKGRCPACHEIITIPAPAAESAGGLAAGTGGAGRRQVAASPAAGSGAPVVCSFCGKAVAAGQYRCNSCGQEVSSPLSERTGAGAGTAAPSPKPRAAMDDHLPPPPVRQETLPADLGLAPEEPAAKADCNLDDSPREKTWRSESVPLGMAAIPAVLGAAIGAGLAAAVWVAVAVETGYEIGWLAVLVGAASGGGASILTREKSPSIGLIAAVIAAAGVIGGSYASFEIMKADVTTEIMIAELTEARDDAEFMALPISQRKARIAEQEAKLNAVGYLDALRESPRNAAFLVVPGLLGLYLGYRVGSGAGKR